MPTKRQRRPLNQTSSQAITEIQMKASNPVEVDRMFVDPHDLHHRVLTCGTKPKEHGLIEECEPIVRLRCRSVSH